jgi:putative endonuclease
MAVSVMNDKIWWVYMIRTQGGQLYTGITTDIQRRWNEHLTGKGGARYFRANKPHSLAYVEQQPDRSCASKREAVLKRLPKAVKESLVLHSIIPAELLLKHD